VVDFAQEITALAPSNRIGEWYVTGRDAADQGVLASYRAETGAVHRWPVESAPLLAAVTDSTGTVFAVGAGGYAFRKADGHPALERVFSHRDMTVVAVDPANGLWAASVGRILHRPPVPAADWAPLWSDKEWSSRFVSIAALAGMIMAASEDGAIVVGHQGLAR